MKDKIKTFNPEYRISPSVARLLMDIEAIKVEMKGCHFPLEMTEQIRQDIRVRSTHYSTQIEGNRLTLKETEQAVKDKKVIFYGLERDATEVRNYWNALIRVGEWVGKCVALNEDLIKRLHGLVTKGSRAGLSPYRTGQNVIKDSGTGAIVYMPAEASDVPALMGSMVAWANRSLKENIPVPVIAAILHYQFVTIHPYYDGNGRTARLLATFLLYRETYSLDGMYSLEEFHAQDIKAYYASLRSHPHHNYYEGREDADLSGWLDYFVRNLASAMKWARQAATGIPAEESEWPRNPVDPRMRVVMGLFDRKEKITANEIAAVLGLSPRMARILVQKWIEEDWIEVAEPSKKTRSYKLKKIPTGKPRH